MSQQPNARDAAPRLLRALALTGLTQHALLAAAFLDHEETHPSNLGYERRLAARRTVGGAKASDVDANPARAVPSHNTAPKFETSAHGGPRGLQRYCRRPRCALGYTAAYAKLIIRTSGGIYTHAAVVDGKTAVPEMTRASRGVTHT